MASLRSGHILAGRPAACSNNQPAAKLTAPTRRRATGLWLHARVQRGVQQPAAPAARAHAHTAAGVNRRPLPGRAARRRVRSKPVHAARGDQPGRPRRILAGVGPAGVYPAGVDPAGVDLAGVA
eukprot:358031-Chlamydomonas_euryale.AAC.7